MPSKPVKKYKCPLVYELLIFGKYYYIGKHCQKEAGGVFKPMTENEIILASGNRFRAECENPKETEERKRLRRAYIDNTKLLKVWGFSDERNARLWEELLIDECKEKYGDICINVREGDDNYGATRGKKKPKASRAVLQYDMDGNFISRYDSIGEVAALLGGSINAKMTGIGSCCAGRTRSAYGYVWKYEDPNAKHGGAVLKFDMNHNLVAEYSGITEAAKSIVTDRPNMSLQSIVSSLSQSIDKEGNSLYGYIWEHKKQQATADPQQLTVGLVDEPVEDLVDEVEDLTED